ncbi:hypothetical protein F2Q69_00012286 [Brassica cretica]|uniref:Uncharacterized protein n=1 Tax=Brassica cretica TaxID=69181 RepID=A0A8S9QMS6_BRACR|nr:hypothetical protein F2Q69_00012286 [Brassica cretica]
MFSSSSSSVYFLGKFKNFLGFFSPGRFENNPDQGDMESLIEDEEYIASCSTAIAYGASSPPSISAYDVWIKSPGNETPRSVERSSCTGWDEAATTTVLRSLKSEDEFSSCRCVGNKIVKVNGGEIEPKSLNLMISASEQRGAGGIMKKVKEKWLSRLHRARLLASVGSHGLFYPLLASAHSVQAISSLKKKKEFKV